MKLIEPYTTTHDSIPAKIGKNDGDGTSGDCISRQAAIDAECEVCQIAPKKERGHNCTYYVHGCKEIECLRALPSAQPDTEKICARIKAEAIKRNVEYMKHGDRYMLGFVDGMRLARCIVDGTIDDPVYFTLSGE